MKFIVFLVLLGLIDGILKTPDKEEAEGLFIIIILCFILFIIGKIIKAVKRGLSSRNKNKVFSDKVIDKLEKITILRLQGALTDEEFEEQNEKIMKKYK